MPDSPAPPSRRQSLQSKLKGAIHKALRRSASETTPTETHPTALKTTEARQDDTDAAAALPQHLRAAGSEPASPVEKARFEREAAPEPPALEERRAWERGVTERKLSEAIIGMGKTDLAGDKE